MTRSGPPKRAPPAPPGTEADERRTRRRAAAEAKAKAKAEEQKARVAAESKRKQEAAQARKQRREEAAAARSAELRRKPRRKTEESEGKEGPTRPKSVPTGHAGGLSSFLTRQADFDAERKANLSHLKEQHMQRENEHIQDRPTVNPRKEAGEGSATRESEDFLERQRQRQVERAHRLEAKRRQLRSEHASAKPKLTQLAQSTAGDSNASMERLTRHVTTQPYSLLAATSFL